MITNIKVLFDIDENLFESSDLRVYLHNALKGKEILDCSQVQEILEDLHAEALDLQQVAWDKDRGTDAQALTRDAESIARAVDFLGNLNQYEESQKDENETV
jgi:hypothetical protein